MGQFFIALLWIAVLCSLSVYAYRIWRRVTKGPKDVREANRLAAEAEAPVDTPSSTAELFRSAAGAPAPPTAPAVPPPSEPAAPPAATPTTVTGPPPPAPPPVAPPPPAPPPPVRRGPTFVPAPDANPTPTPNPTPPTGGVARAGLFAPRSATPSDPGTEAPEVTRGPAAPRPTVAEALAGIAMPCGLAPLVDPEAGLDPHRVAFSTSGVDAAEVGARVGDELERLGFGVRSVSETGVEATRGTILVHVVLHPDAATEMIGSAPAYPTVPPGTVVVEFST